MTRTNLVLGGALVVQLALVAFMMLGKSDAGIAKLEPILDLDATAVTKIEVFAKDAKTASDGAPAIVIDRSSGTWQLASHYNYPAVGSKVDELITKLTALQARGPVATKAATHRKFSVADDKHERRLIIHRKVGEPLEIYLGGSAGQRQTALRIKGQEKVYGATGLTPYSIATTASSWVKTEYFKMVGGAALLVVKNTSGELELRRSAIGEPWKQFIEGAEAPAPEGKELDGPKVAGLGNKLANITMTEPANPSDPFTAVATVRFKALDSANEHTLAIGPEEDKGHRVRIDKQAPVWVSKYVVGDFLELKGEALYRDPPKPGDAPPAANPTDLQNLPPEILRQLQQQGIAPR